MSRRKRRQGPGAIDLLEGAVHLLRTAPSRALAAYYLGALPFVIALLYFWSDMSRSAFARERLEPLAAVLALLFVWMKGWQLLFVRRLREHVLGVELPVLTPGATTGLLAALTFWSATGFLAIPISLIFAWWTWSFYQCLLVSAGTAGKLDREVLAHTWRLGWVWHGQNLTLFLALLAIGFVLFINIAVTFVSLPFLLKLLLGIESQFTQSLAAMFNTTFITAVLAITWLCLDPVAKAACLLRVFHAEAIHTGDDIRAELRSIVRRRAAGLLALGATAILSLFILTAAVAQEPASPGSQLTSQPAANGDTRAAPGELDKAIDEVMQRREFTWRMPREELEEATTDKSWFQQALQKVFDWIADIVKKVGRTVGEILRWIFDNIFGHDRAPSTPGTGWTDATRGLFILLLIVLAGAIGYLIYRLWKHYQGFVPEVVAQAVSAAPDLDDDSLTAAQLPEDEWLRLAREMMAKGEFRLALRALYLGGLAHLAGRGLVTIARYKSNWDYARELGRRAHALPDVMNAFRTNVTVFDRVWYGRDEATPELLTEFENNLRRIAAA